MEFLGGFASCGAQVKHSCHVCICPLLESPLKQRFQSPDLGSEPVVRPDHIPPVLAVKQAGLVVKTHFATQGGGHQVSCPVVPHAVLGLDFFLRRQHRWAKHHGVAAGNVLHQRVAKAGRAAYAGAQANGLEFAVHKLRAPAIQANRLLQVLRWLLLVYLMMIMMAPAL